MAARRQGGRSAWSPISGYEPGERAIGVVSSDPIVRAVLAEAADALAPMGAEALDLSTRTLERLGRADFGLVVADLREADPVALVDGLGRRLVAVRRRGAAVLVCHWPGADATRPAIRAVAESVASHRLLRPVTAASASAMLGLILGVPMPGLGAAS